MNQRAKGNACRRRTGSRTSFTPPGLSLLEVLVAIGVILVLIGLLLPAVQRAREVARRTRCATQLGSHMRVLAAYAVDFRDAWPFALADRRAPELQRFGEPPLPSWYREPPFSAINGFWHLPVLDAYAEDPFHESLICPSDTETLLSRDAAALEFNIDPATIRGTLEYRLSMAMVLDPRSLNPAAPAYDETVFVGQTHSAVQFPAAKAAIFDFIPLHDVSLPNRPRYKTGQPIRRNVAGADGAVGHRSSLEIVPAVLMPGTYAPGGETHSQELRKLDFTPHGVRGHDW